jgi:DNA-binding SARP family transcriptional activator
VLERTSAVLSLWRGEPYAEVPDTGWLAPVRQHLVAARLEVAELRVQALLQLARPEEAVGELDPLLAEQPLRERLWALRMTGLYQAGRQAEALAAFGRIHQVLTAELGVDPGPELRDLQRQILDQDPALHRRPPVGIVAAGRIGGLPGPAAPSQPAGPNTCRTGAAR